MSCHACEQQHELKEATKFLLQGGETKEKLKMGPSLVFARLWLLEQAPGLCFAACLVPSPAHKLCCKEESARGH